MPDYIDFWSDYIPTVDYQLEIPYGLDSLASKPIAIHEFINSKIKESEAKLDVSALKSLANSCVASFLLEQRKQIRPLDQMTRIDTLCFMLLARQFLRRLNLMMKGTNYFATLIGSLTM